MTDEWWVVRGEVLKIWWVAPADRAMWYPSKLNMHEGLTKEEAVAIAAVLNAAEKVNNK